MQLGSSKEFLCLTILNPCVAHCSMDSRPWVLTLKERRVPWLRRGFVCLQIQMNFDATINLQHANSDIGNLVRGASLSDTSTILVGKGCWSIFISFSALAVLGILLTNEINLQVHGYCCSFRLRVFQGCRILGNIPWHTMIWGTR
jgi:hypothetical protein